MRRFYCPPDKIDPNAIVLGSDETRHLRDVLRLRAGDQVSVFDGNGSEYLCSISSVSRTNTLLMLERRIEPASPESPFHITVAAAILPGEKYEITVQKAAELGVRQLQPLYTARCEAKHGRGTRRLERWQKIALESAKQSGRATLMEITQPLEFATFVRSAGQNAKGPVIFFSERDGTGFSSIPPPGPNVTAVFGPKGGWDDAELAAAKNAGFTVVTFGGRIMRAETAAIAMTAILQHRFGDLS